MQTVKYVNRRGLSPAEYARASETLREMTAAWVAVLSKAMMVTGKGYKRAPQGRTGRGEDRRSDKLNTVNRKALRGVQPR